MANNIVLRFTPKLNSAFINHVQRRHMPVNVPPTATGKRRFRLAVETDPHKLVNYCCGLNYHVDEPPIKLKPDEEYPEWLWKLRITPKRNSWEMEKGTKEYYMKLAEEGVARNVLLRSKYNKEKKVVGKPLKEREEYVHRMRFAALAHLEEDAGFDQESIEVDWLSKMNGQRLRVSDYYLPVNKNKVLYMDKIPGNIHLKNYHNDHESTFKQVNRLVTPRPPKTLQAFQDSVRRHPHSVH